MTSTQKRPLHVLLLEDEDADAALLRRNLSQTFCVTMERIETAASMRRALVTTPDWDIVISDYSMPSFTALDALQILNEDGRDVPFIIVSGTMPDETAVRAMREGARDYVMKDNLNRLGPAVERELEEATRRRALRLLEAERTRLLARERELRESAEAAARLKDEFLTVLSHELRTPLTSILGWARMLRHDDLNPSILNGVEAIERNGRALTRLIEDLLDLSAILSGRLKLSVCAVDYSALVREAIDSVARAAAERGVAIDVDVADGCHLWGDIDRLSQIVVNLLTNSIKFTAKGGRISISLTSSPSEATLVVRDTGIGIPSEFLPYVFDHFRQADGSVSRAFGGLGMGLSIVRHLTEMHGGHVSAESKGTGQGATFTVQIPRTVAGTVSENRPIPLWDRAALAGRTVLLVNDDAGERDVIRRALEQFGASVVSVATAVAAIDALKWAGADLLISDLELPVQNGYELMASVRRLPGGEIPAIALSSSAEPAVDRQRALAAGFSSYLTKPVTIPNIVTPVVELLHHLTSH